MRRAQRIYLAVFALSCVLGLGGLAIFNGLADVYGAYPWLALKRLQPYRNADLTTRRAKAEMIAGGDCEVLLLGTSRVQVGLPVDDPIYHNDHVYNLGLIGANLAELETAFNFALSHNHLKRVIFGTDFETYTDVSSVRYDLEYSRFNPHLSLVDYHCRNLLGIDVTRKSRDLFEQARHRPSTPSAKRGFVPSTTLQKYPQRIEFSLIIGDALRRPDIFGAYHYSQQRLGLFREILRRCRDRGIDLVVFVPPVHALQSEAIHMANLWPVFEQWETDLVKVVAEENPSVPLWDFSGYRGPNSESVPANGNPTAAMKWYRDCSHFAPELGRLVLKRMLEPDSKQDPDAFGVRLTSENIQAHLAALRTDRENYLVSHPGEIRWLRAVAHRAKSFRARFPKATRPTPTADQNQSFGATPP